MRDRHFLLPLVLVGLCACSSRPLIFVDPNRRLTTAKEALDFADPIMYAYYPKAELRRQRPFQVNFKDGNWTIVGSSPCHICVDTVFQVVLQAEPARLVRLVELRE